MRQRGGLVADAGGAGGIVSRRRVHGNRVGKDAGRPQCGLPPVDRPEAVRERCLRTAVHSDRRLTCYSAFVQPALKVVR